MPIRDTRMMAKAMEQRWPISESARKAIVSRLIRIIADPNSKPREIIAATKGLIAAEGQNQKDEHAKIDEFRNRVLTIAQRCGIDVNLLGTSQAAVRGPAAGAPVNAVSADERTG